MHWVALGIGCLAAALALFLAGRLRRRREEARAYVKTVRYVLSDDPDAAIEALSDAARLGSPEAVETYLALGTLFRRTGDLSRAIRLHRNMLLRPGLDRAARGEVERELAEDYRRGGMLAEAAQVLEPLARAGDAAALEALRDVRVEQGDLAAAAELQRRLGGERLLAHILAALSRQRGPAGGRRAAEDAVAACPASADALLALAEAAAAWEPQVALSSVARALEAEPGAALLAWPALAAVGDAAGAGRVVEERIEKAPSDAALHLLRGRLLASQGRRPEALAAFARALELDSSGEVTLTMRELLRQADAPEAADLEARHDLAMAALLRPVRPPSCRRCGAAAAARSWRCPRCGSFDAYP